MTGTSGAPRERAPGAFKSSGDEGKIKLRNVTECPRTSQDKIEETRAWKGTVN